MPDALSVSKESTPSNSEMREAQIYRVAAELIQQKGYDATSMNDIEKAETHQSGTLLLYRRQK